MIEVPGLTWPGTRPWDCTDEPFTRIWLDATNHPVPDAPEDIVLLCAQCGLDCT